MQFRIKFVNNNKGHIVINKKGYAVGLDELYSVQHIFKDTKFQANKIQPKILPAFVKSIKSLFYYCPIPFKLALKLNKKYKGVFNKSNVLTVKIIGSLSKYTCVEYHVRMNKKDKYIKKVSIKYKVMEDRLLKGWSDAGYPLQWDIRVHKEDYNAI